MFCYTGGSASTAARCSSSVQIIREAWLSIMHCLSLQPEVRTLNMQQLGVLALHPCDSRSTFS